MRSFIFALVCLICVPSFATGLFDFGVTAKVVPHLANHLPVQQDCPNGVCPLPAVRNVVAAPVNVVRNVASLPVGVVRNVVKNVQPFNFVASNNTSCGCGCADCNCGAAVNSFACSEPVVTYSEPIVTVAYSEPVVTYRTVANWTPVRNMMRERPQVLRKVVRRVFRGRCN